MVSNFVTSEVTYIKIAPLFCFHLFLGDPHVIYQGFKAKFIITWFVFTSKKLSENESEMKGNKKSEKNIEKG